ncbi:HPC2 and ubinuclein domain-containing protein [Ditylenchus destructor]|nr:HPC2 and ubinuclein domain-containing protein [Ditylenchus destructor]
MASMLASIGQPKKKKAKQESLTVIELKLFTPTSSSYPSFDYEEIKKNLGISEEEATEDDPFRDFDADELVKRLEAKYANTYSKKGKKKKIRFAPEDVMDKGMGYDLSDAFIDDAEAYDEWVPSTMDTAKRGYYINKGLLEFRQLDDSASEVSDDDEESKNAKKQSNRGRKRKTAPILRESPEADALEVIEEDVERELQAESQQEKAQTDSGPASPKPEKVKKKKEATKSQTVTSNPASKSVSPKPLALSDEPSTSSAQVSAAKVIKKAKAIRDNSSAKKGFVRLSDRGGVPPTRKIALLNSALARVKAAKNANKPENGSDADTGDNPASAESRDVDAKESSSVSSSSDSDSDEESESSSSEESEGQKSTASTTPEGATSAQEKDA